MLNFATSGLARIGKLKREEKLESSAERQVVIASIRRIEAVAPGRVALCNICVEIFVYKYSVLLVLTVLHSHWDPKLPLDQLLFLRKVSRALKGLLLDQTPSRVLESLIR
jgi:hypothetical protein